MVTQDSAAADPGTAEEPGPGAQPETPPEPSGAESEGAAPPSPADNEPTLRDLLAEVKAARDEARAASGRASRLERQQQQVAQQMSEQMQQFMEQIRQAQSTEISALAEALSQDLPEEPDTERRPISLTDRLEQARQRRQPSQSEQPEPAQALQSQLQAALDAQRVQQFVEQAYDFLAENGIPPSKFHAAQQTDPDRWLETGPTLEAAFEDFKRKALDWKTTQQSQAAPQGTPPAPSPAGAGGPRTLADLEQLLSLGPDNGGISERQFVQMAKNVEGGPAFLERMERLGVLRNG